MTPLEKESLARVARAVGIRAPVVWEAETESTNATAVDLAEAACPEWTLVASSHQTRGRGRLGRTWASVPGEALLFSFVLRPEMPAGRAPILTLLAGASMAGACEAATGVEVRCKWPNDLMVGERKAGGILMEGRVTGDRLDHAVVGIGLNLAGSPPDVDGATGLGDADGPTILEGFLRRFREAYAPTAPSFPDAVVDSYRPLCSTLGRRVRATTRGGEATEGLAADIDTSGGLLLETAKGRRLVRFGEIEHLRG